MNNIFFKGIEIHWCIGKTRIYTETTKFPGEHSDITPESQLQRGSYQEKCYDKGTKTETTG